MLKTTDQIASTVSKIFERIMQDKRDKRGFAGALLMDLSQAFDTINHELLIAKLHAYGFFIEACEVFFKLSTRKTSKCQDHYNFQFLDLVTLRSSTRTGPWSNVA